MPSPLSTLASSPSLELSLAPMEGVTTFPMRLWLHLAGAPAVMTTPFLRVTPTFPLGPLPPRFAPELGVLRGTVPYHLIPQLMAASRDDFLRAAELLLPTAPFIDLNCGCPSPNCVGSGAGSSLLRQAESFATLIAQLSAGVGGGALSVKMRTGFHVETEFPGLLAGIQGLPLARLSIHGRTRPARYTGKANWELINAAALAASVPVVASGDIVDAASLNAALGRNSSVSGVMIGRGALRNPWLFAGLRPLLSRPPLAPEGATADSLGAMQATPMLSLAALQAALLSQALLHELEATAPAELDRLAKDFLFMESCGTDAGCWIRLVERLSHALYGQSRSGTGELSGCDWGVSRQTMGRLKMLWGYLRSSLPAPYFEPRLLRAADLPTLLGGLRAVHAQNGAPELLPLRHAPALDWLYSGERRQLESCSTESPQSGS